MQLTVQSNNAFNPLSLDLSKFIDVQHGSGMDPSNPNFREALISHALLKEGGVLALENLKAKELIFPLKLNSVTSSGTVAMVSQLNEIVTAPGATVSWQDDGMSQPTIFDLISGQFDVEYNYREAQQHWLSGKLRLFCQPLGRVQAPRALAAASGVGPVLMVSPFGSGGQSILGASAGGYGGRQQASGGVFYPGAPSLAGDAPALLQLSYTGPLPNTATNTGTVPNTLVSVLPDALYQPLKTVPDFSRPGGTSQSFITGCNGPEGITVSSSFIYWCNTGNNTIGRANLDGTGANQSFITGCNTPVGIANDGTNIYWTNQGNGTIGKATLAGGSVNQAWVTVGGSPTLQGIAVDSSFAYVLASAPTPTLYKYNSSSGSLALSTGVAASPRGIAVFGSKLVWANSTLNVISTIDTSLISGFNQYFIEGCNSPWGVAFDLAGRIYWTNQGTSTIGRANSDGSGAQQSYLTGLSTPFGVAADSGHVYWTNNGTNAIGRSTFSFVNQAAAVASAYVTYTSAATTTNVDIHQFNPVPASEPTAMWAGPHRLLAIARASGAGAGTLTTNANQLVNSPAVASVPASTDWGLYDLGVYSLRASEPPLSQVGVTIGTYPAAGSQVTLDVTAYITLPDRSTWMLPAAQISPSQYGLPLATGAQNALSGAPYTNTLVLDDVINDQLIYQGASLAAAPSATGLVSRSSRMTQFTRGTVPRPNPRDGLPILAIVGVGQNAVPSQPYLPGASWVNPQNQQVTAQVNVLERTKYILG